MYLRVIPNTTNGGFKNVRSYKKRAELQSWGKAAARAIARDANSSVPQFCHLDTGSFRSQASS